MRSTKDYFIHILIDMYFSESKFEYLKHELTFYYFF